jgi:hypothetical protein
MLRANNTLKQRKDNEEGAKSYENQFCISQSYSIRSKVWHYTFAAAPRPAMSLRLSICPRLCPWTAGMIGVLGEENMFEKPAEERGGGVTDAASEGLVGGEMKR